MLAIISEQIPPQQLRTSQIIITNFQSRFIFILSPHIAIPRDLERALVIEISAWQILSFSFATVGLFCFEGKFHRVSLSVVCTIKSHRNKQLILSILILTNVNGCMHLWVAVPFSTITSPHGIVPNVSTLASKDFSRKNLRKALRCFSLSWNYPVSVAISLPLISLFTDSTSRQFCATFPLISSTIFT